MEQDLPESTSRLCELAERLDYFTEADYLLLADITPATAEAHRKRGEGPAYARIGRRYFYPRTKVVEWMNGRVKERVPASTAKDVL